MTVALPVGQSLVDMNAPAMSEAASATLPDANNGPSAGRDLFN